MNLGNEQYLPKSINMVIRAIFASFPVASSAGQLWSEIETDKQLERIKNLCKNLEKKMEKNKSKNLVPSVDLVLIRNIIDKIRFERRTDKIEYYASILEVSSTNSTNDHSFFQHKFVELVDRLQREHIHLLKIFSFDKNLRYEELVSLFEIETKDKYTREIFISILADLEQNVLIYRIPFGDIHTSHWSYKSDDFQAEWRPWKYSLSNLGKKFIQQISRN